MKTTFTVSNGKFAQTNPIYFAGAWITIVIVWFFNSVENRPRSWRPPSLYWLSSTAKRIGWINMPQNYDQSLYFTISRRLRAVVKADGCITKYW